MTFNIGSQQAGIVNNVAGNQTIHGGQAAATDALAQLDHLHRELVAARLHPTITAQVGAELDALDHDLRRPDPDQPTIKGRLDRITHILKSTGALAQAGGGLISALTALVDAFG